MIDISIDGVDGVVVNLRSMADRTVPAIVRGLNYAIRAAQDVMAPAIAQDLGLETDKVRKQLPIRKATASTLTATLSASRKKIPLMAFQAQGPRPSRGKGNGVSYRLPGSAGRIANAFIVTTKSGHEGVFVRISPSERKSKRGWSKDLPIVERFGPSLGHVFAKYRAIGLARAQEAFRNSFTRDISGAGAGSANV